MPDQERSHVEFRDPPQVRHVEISDEKGMPTHRRIALYDAHHDVETAAPLLTLVVPHETLEHDAFKHPDVVAITYSNETADRKRAWESDAADAAMTEMRLRERRDP
ncbi:MAG: hypothetical protein NVSMB21_25500 [Vulcanimicrobiaceae bacterium]